MTGSGVGGVVGGFVFPALPLEVDGPAFFPPDIIVAEFRRPVKLVCDPTETITIDGNVSH